MGIIAEAKTTASAPPMEKTSKVTASVPPEKKEETSKTEAPEKKVTDSVASEKKEEEEIVPPAPKLPKAAEVLYDEDGHPYFHWQNVVLGCICVAIVFGVVLGVCYEKFNDAAKKCTAHVEGYKQAIAAHRKVQEDMEKKFELITRVIREDLPATSKPSVANVVDCTPANDRICAGAEHQTRRILSSADGRYDLIMQSDRNLVIYDSPVHGGKAVWASNTQCNARGNYALELDAEKGLFAVNLDDQPASKFLVFSNPAKREKARYRWVELTAHGALRFEMHSP